MKKMMILLPIILASCSGPDVKQTIVTHDIQISKNDYIVNTNTFNNNVFRVPLLENKHNLSALGNGYIVSMEKDGTVINIGKLSTWHNKYIASVSYPDNTKSHLYIVE